jgi:hypothetical protein
VSEIANDFRRVQSLYFIKFTYKNLIISNKTTGQRKTARINSKQRVVWAIKRQRERIVTTTITSYRQHFSAPLTAGRDPGSSSILAPFIKLSCNSWGPLAACKKSARTPPAAVKTD